MNIRWTLINMTNSLDLKILQITWTSQTEETNFPGRKLNFSKLSRISDIYVAVPIKIINMKHFGT